MFHWRYVLLVSFAFLFSIAGILVGAYGSNDPVNGQRGGAITVALSFFVLFVHRSGNGTKVLQTVLEFLRLQGKIQKRTQGISGVSQPEGLAVKDDDPQLTALLKKFEYDADTQKNQNIALAISSVLGTLVWGFGNFVSGCLKPEASLSYRASLA